MRTRLVGGAVILSVVFGCGAPRGGKATTTAPYGAWTSPLSASQVAEQGHDLDQPVTTSNGVYWLEAQADGHNALRVRRPDGTTHELVPGADVRTEIHAYGGGAYLVDGTRILYTDAKDQRLYLVDGDAPPRAVTAPGKAWYAGCVLDRPRNRALCVRDDASAGGMPVDTIVAVDLTGATAPTILVSGQDFYAQLHLSPDGTSLAWVTWQLPSMPWNRSDLVVASLNADGTIGTPTHVAGGPHESIGQPEWSPDGDLYFTSDRTGFWNLYRQHAGTVEAMWPLKAEIGLAPWVIDESGFAFASPTEIVAAVTEHGQTALMVFDVATRATRRLAPTYSVAYRVRAEEGRAVAIVASTSEPRSVVEIEVATGATTVIERSTTTAIPAGLIARH